MAEVHAFNQLFRSMRKRRGQDPAGLSATWVNLALSANALRRLTSDAEVEQFTDPHFKSGLARTAFLLNDPVDDDGRPIDWKVGAPDNEADVLVIIASDDPKQASARVKRIRALIREAARAHGVVPLTLIWDQVGHILPAPLRGHEHFGFKDGVSQPGVRGLAQINPPQFFTERIFDASVLQDDAFLPEFSRPGQPLVWPGQFVFGYNRQSPQHPRNPRAIGRGRTRDHAGLGP